jgi:hypothetical protein
MSVVNQIITEDYFGSLLIANLLSGSNQTLVLNAFGPEMDTTVTDNNNQLIPGESVVLGGSTVATVLGSGTVTPGVNVLGVIVPLGVSVPVVILETQAGQIVFLYPEATPNLLGAVALIVNASATAYTFPGGVICFASGTMIETPDGEIPVQDIRPGMTVLTRDNGAQEVVWAQSRTLSTHILDLRPNLRPIVIRKDALGENVPRRDMIVSPQHRILVGSRIVSRMFDEPEVLVAAKHLTEISGIKPAPCHSGVTYTHFMFDRHQIVKSEGAWCESLFPGAECLKSVSVSAKAEIISLFPALSDYNGVHPRGIFNPARTIANGQKGRSLARRHVRNTLPLLTNAYGP